VGSIGKPVPVNEVVYIRFKHANYGYDKGTILAVIANERDTIGVHVWLHSKQESKLVRAWSDLGCFQELSAMEVLAYASEGSLPEEPVLPRIYR
jgi:hypothetical protein